MTSAGRFRRGFACVLLAGASAVALAACSSTTTTTTTTTTTVPSPAKSVADIKQSFGILFDLSNPAIDPKLAVIQNGESLRAAMTKALKSSLAKEAHGASVKSVTLLGPAGCQAEVLTSPCAKVVYDILGASQTVLLENSVGFAVYQPPTWKVSKTTICTLLTLENGNVPPAGC